MSEVGASLSRNADRQNLSAFISRGLPQLFILSSLIWCCDVSSNEKSLLVEQNEHRLTFDRHLIDDVPYHTNAYIAVIEIPAGDVAKWEVDPAHGYLEWELSGDGRREVQYLPYPSNYGFIPQTLLSGALGGDNDPIDVLVLGPRVPRGAIQRVRILGGIRMLDNSEVDDKLIAAPFSGPFSEVQTFQDLREYKPGALEIIRLWFENYKLGSMTFLGYVEQNEAQILIERAHTQWLTGSLERRDN